MKPNYEDRVDKLLEEIKQLKAELRKKDELLFAYESVCAPVNPLLAENERLREALRGFQRLLIYKKEILEKVEQALNDN